MVVTERIIHIRAQGNDLVAYQADYSEDIIHLDFRGPFPITNEGPGVISHAMHNTITGCM